MQITHTCQNCNAVLAVHEHANYEEIKACLAGMKPLCDQCASWPQADADAEDLDLFGELLPGVCPDCDGIGQMVNITGEEILTCQTCKGTGKIAPQGE